jgi:hypothetical protein
MTNANEKKSKGVFARFRKKSSGGGTVDASVATDTTPEQNGHEAMIEQFEAVKRSPGHLTGWDFDRAFEFIERYPDSNQAEILIGQMYATTGNQLKGLSYGSAVKILERMPGHAGADSIVRGMYKLEVDFIKELRSDVISYMLKIIPDHPLGAELTKALAQKNLTNAFDFVVANPDNPYTELLIKAMFERDPNIAVLLFQEKLDHPRVGSIFSGIYNITSPAEIKKLTPNAVIFILDVAPDHPMAQQMIEVLVESNYVRAYDYVKSQPDHSLAPKIIELILQRKPELKALFGNN